MSLEWKLGTIILSLRAVKPTHSVKRDAWLLITIQNHLKTIKTYFSQKVAVNESTNKMLHLNSHNIVIIDAAKPHIFLLVKTWHLHYPQFNLNTHSSGLGLGVMVRGIRFVMLVVFNIVLSCYS